MGVCTVVRLLRDVEMRPTLVQLEEGLVLRIVQLDAVLVSAPPFP